MINPLYETYNFWKYMYSGYSVSGPFGLCVTAMLKDPGNEILNSYVLNNVSSTCGGLIS